MLLIQSTEKMFVILSAGWRNQRVLTPRRGWTSKCVTPRRNETLATAQHLEHISQDQFCAGEGLEIVQH